MNFNNSNLAPLHAQIYDKSTSFLACLLNLVEVQEHDNEVTDN